VVGYVYRYPDFAAFTSLPVSLRELIGQAYASNEPKVPSLDGNNFTLFLRSLMWPTVKTGNDIRSKFNRPLYLLTETFRMVLALIFTWSLLSRKIFSSRFFQYNKP